MSYTLNDQYALSLGGDSEAKKVKVAEERYW